MDEKVQDRIAYHNEAFQIWGQDYQPMRRESIDNIMKRHEQMLEISRKRNMVIMMTAPLQR